MNLPSHYYFYSLKPPECIRAEDPGSHTICVCAEHEDVNLILHALSRKLKSKNLIAGAVCDDESVNCMIGDCGNCPGKSGVLYLFDKILKELDIELKHGKIKYNFRYFLFFSQNLFLRNIDSFHKFYFQESTSILIFIYLFISLCTRT